MINKKILRNKLKSYSYPDLGEKRVAMIFNFMSFFTFVFEMQLNFISKLIFFQDFF
jgi:hypothetical protein